MIRLTITSHALGECENFTQDLPWRPGLTARALLEQFREQLPPEADVAIAVDGERLAEDELGLELEDEADVLLAVDPDAVVGTAIVYSLVAAAVSLAVSYVFSLLAPRPQPAGVPQDRGDEKSAAEGWSGIQTNYGQGLPIPYSYGKIGMGGQVVSTDVFASTGSGAQQEFLRLVLALGEGPMDKIGAQKLLEADGLGGYTGQTPGPAIPDGIEVNGNLLDHTNSLPGARIWTRPGELTQTPLPTSPFRGASQLVSVGEQLNDADSEAIITYSGGEQISTLSFTISFPGGIYAQDPQGNSTAYPVTFELRWRPQGTQTWRGFFVPQTGLSRPTVTLGQQPRLGTAVESFGGDLNSGGAPEPGPFEVRVRRLTARGGSQVVDGALWRQVVFNINQPLAYPRISLLGFEILASGRLSGALPEIKLGVDGLLVRVWDESTGFSGRTWDVPAAPFDWMNRPPGRNPAWVAADFLTRPFGLGKWVTDADIDWPSFRRWSILCDQDPNTGSPWGEAAFTSDFSQDNPRPAWEVFLKILAAGRGTPIMVGRKIGVSYAYRDAHSDALVSVPAKAPLQLFTSGNVEEFQITWLPKSNRPTALQFQFLNEDKRWEQDVLTIPDPDAKIPNEVDADPARLETEQAFGRTRPSQLEREGVFFHRANRLIRREISFVTGPWALSATKGDLIEFEHEILRPFDTDIPTAMSVIDGGASVSVVTVDHPVSGAGLELVVRKKSDGSPQRADITLTTPVAGGTQLTLGGLVEAEKGMPCAVGVKDKITQVYEVASISLAQTVKRQVRALQWVPELYDPLPPPPGGDTPENVPSQADATQQYLQKVQDLSVTAMRDAAHLVSWNKPEGRGEAACRVWVQNVSIGAWFLVAETTLSEHRYDGFLPWQAYKIAVSIENSLGVYQLPEEAAQLDFTAEEFPPFSPPRVTNLTKNDQPEGVDLRFDHLDLRDLDYFELRVGSSWASAEVIERTKEPQCLYRNPRWSIPTTAPTWAAARSRSGLYGRPQKFTGSVWLPHPRGFVAAKAHLPTAQTFDVFDGVSIVNGQYQLDAGKNRGTVELEAFEPSGAIGAAPYYWMLLYNWWEVHLGTVDSWDFTLNSGEARWRTVDTRQASSGKPGVDWQTLVDDLTMTIDDMPDDLLVQGHVGEPGSHTLLQIEYRIRVNSIWSIYQPWVGDGPQLTSSGSPDRIQFRLTLLRESAEWEIYVNAMTAQAYL